MAAICEGRTTMKQMNRREALVGVSALALAGRAAAQTTDKAGGSFSGGSKVFALSAITPTKAANGSQRIVAFGGTLATGESLAARRQQGIRERHVEPAAALQGESAVAVLRAAQRQAHRLHQGASRIAAGESEDSVLRGLRLFTKQIPRFKAQLRRWPATRIARILPQLTQAELDCKSTGYPDETICRRVLSGIARLAAARP